MSGFRSWLMVYKYQPQNNFLTIVFKVGLQSCLKIAIIGMKPLLEILFDSNPQGWWMWFTFIKRMNNILILVVVRLGWIV